MQGLDVPSILGVEADPFLFGFSPYAEVGQSPRGREQRSPPFRHPPDVPRWGRTLIGEFGKDAFHASGETGLPFLQEDPPHREEMLTDGIGMLGTGHADH